MASGNYAKVKAWRAANPEKVLEQARRYHAKHPETRRKAVKNYRERHLEKIRERDRLAQRAIRKADPEGQRLRNLAYASRQEALKTQKAGRPRSNYCEICAIEERTVFDHSHQKGHFRGWICDRCNKILGLVRDDISYLKALQIYLEHQEYAPQYKAA